ncbi:MAG: sporulation protein [Ruminococcus sp.]|nr:sporulation protein [Ruminococcus sp.]
MKSELPFNRAASVFVSAVLLCANTSSIANAEETTSANTTGTTEETSAAADSASENEETEKEETEWYKAELGDYDDSLSLISYEASPEAENSGEKKNKNKNKKPTPVALNVTGGYVGDIPGFESEPEIESNPGQFAIVTYGWGHGVGMSQNGANFYATYSGWTYQDILFHYYPDTYLMDTGMAEDEEITVAGVSGDVVSMVSQIVFNEVGSGMNYEAIKAQAVAVYTYCKYHNNDACDLRCKPNPPQVVVDAVNDVLGQALYYDDDYALTMFSASCGGVTANCDEVFWADLPYLRSVSSDYDAGYDPHYGTVTYIDDFQLRNMIQSAYGIKLSKNPENWIQPTYSEETGYVTSVNIDDQLTVRGYEFKLDIGLKSSKFTIYYTPRPDGEEIPEHGSSTPRVVNAEYEHTPAVYYANNQPTDIGSQTALTDPEAYENPNEEPSWYEVPTEEPPTEPTSEPTSEPVPVPFTTGQIMETTVPDLTTEAVETTSNSTEITE